MINENKKGDELLKEIEQSNINNCKPITLEEFNKFMKEYVQQPMTVYFTKEGMIQFDKIMKEELKSLGLTPYIPAPLENDNKI
jgi:hypothetical protein